VVEVVVKRNEAKRYAKSKKNKKYTSIPSKQYDLMGGAVME